MKFLIPAIIVFAARAFAASSGDTSVAYFHGTPDHAGNYTVPGLSHQNVGSVGMDTKFNGVVSGNIYTQPLYWKPASASGGLIITATESNMVYALDSETGKVAWSTSLGPPLPLANQPCGNIDPLGVTGTPVIDAAKGVVYLGAVNDNNGTAQHLIYGLDLRTGAVLSGFPLDVSAGLTALGLSFDPTVENQRGALALLNGKIFVPYGGHWGDCGDYHGVVVAVDTVTPKITDAFVTRALKGGIWAPGGITEADNKLFFTTGNTDDAQGWQDGEGVFRVGSDLASQRDTNDSFAPSNWQTLDDEDLDLSGVDPMLITVPDSGPRVLALGKDGNAYLLSADKLGGIGGQLDLLKAANSQIITAPAAYHLGKSTIVAYQTSGVKCPNGSFISGIGAIAVSAGASGQLQLKWCAALDGGGSPIVTTTDGTSQPIVWAVGAEGDNLLHGFRGDTGVEIYTGTGGAMANLRHFATILVADGHFYVAADNRIYAFDLP